MQRLPLVVLVLVAALLAAGCGSKKSAQPMSPADWANGVCSAITTWENSIKSSGDSLKAGNLSKDSLQSTADDVTSATKTLQSDLKGLGKPNTQAGQQAKNSIDKLSSDLQTNTDSIKSAAAGVSNASGVVTAASTIRTTLVTMRNEVSSTYTSLKQLDPGGELQTAFQQSSSCQQVSSST